MAITQRVCNNILTNTSQAFAATEGTAVTSIHLCNISPDNATVNIYVLKNDGSTTVPTENNKIYNSLTIQGTDTYVIDTEKMIMANGGQKIFGEILIY